MPELPEVETVRRGLAPVMEGAVISAVEQRRANLRFAFPDRFVERLTGQTVTALSRRAKYLLADLSSGDVLVMHLGMSGSFRIAAGDKAQAPGKFHHPKGKDQRHDHVVFTFASGDQVVYNDPRRFGFMDLIARSDLSGHKFFNLLGVEPLGNAMHPQVLATAALGKSAPLKALLLDQHVIAGIGNIYACEALWRAGLSPRRAANTLVRKDGRPRLAAERLSGFIIDVLNDAIAAGGSSLRDHRQADGELGYFQHAFAVYDRQGMDCHRPDCAGTIRRIVQSGRSSFYCPRCQH